MKRCSKIKVRKLGYPEENLVGHTHVHMTQFSGNFPSRFQIQFLSPRVLKKWSCTVALFSIYSESKKECDSYNATTAAETSDGEEEAEGRAKRKRKPRVYEDCVTGMPLYTYLYYLAWTAIGGDGS